MKKLIALLCVLSSPFGPFAQAQTNQTPILRGLLQSDLNANSHAITNAASISAAQFTLGGVAITTWPSGSGGGGGGNTNAVTNFDGLTTNVQLVVTLIGTNAPAYPLWTTNTVTSTLTLTLFIQTNAVGSNSLAAALASEGQAETNYFASQSALTGAIATLLSDIATTNAALSNAMTALVQSSTNSISSASIIGLLTNSTTGNAATATVASAVTGTLTNSTTGNAATATVASAVAGTLTNSTTGNAATATVASAVTGTLTNSTTGNAATATVASAVTGTLTNIIAGNISSATNTSGSSPLFSTNGSPFNGGGLTNINAIMATCVIGNLSLYSNSSVEFYDPSSANNYSLQWYRESIGLPSGTIANAVIVSLGSCSFNAGTNIYIVGETNGPAPAFTDVIFGPQSLSSSLATFVFSNPFQATNGEIFTYVISNNILAGSNSFAPYLRISTSGPK
jgi:hypothetical protein